TAGEVHTTLASATVRAACLYATGTAAGAAVSAAVADLVHGTSRTTFLTGSRTPPPPLLGGGLSGGAGPRAREGRGPPPPHPPAGSRRRNAPGGGAAAAGAGCARKGRCPARRAERDGRRPRRHTRCRGPALPVDQRGEKARRPRRASDDGPGGPVP